MHRIGRTLTILLGIQLLAAVQVPAETNSPVVTSEATRVTRWSEDLECYAKELPARHKDFYKLISRRNFEQQVSGLKREIPNRTDAEITLELMRLTAGLRVSHTRVGWPTRDSTFEWYPLYLHWFSDGLVIIAAAPEYREAVGARVVRMDSRTPEQVETAVAAFISRENEATLRSESPMFMRNATLLKFLEVADPDGRMRLEVRKRDGQVATLEIKPATATTLTNWITIQDAFSLPTTLARRHPRKFYWFEYLTNAHALYVQYNVCAQAPDQPFTNFVSDLFTCLRSHPLVEHGILDLRYNGGGNSEVVKPLVNTLRAHPALIAKGRIYTLIGRRTASSGMMAALDFKNALNATLVGEPTGGKPNAYGDVRTFQLPHSQLQVRYSTKLFHLVNRGDPPSVNPDIHVSLSLTDFLAARDPVLETALSASQTESPNGM